MNESTPATTVPRYATVLPAQREQSARQSQLTEDLLAALARFGFQVAAEPRGKGTVH